MFNLLTDGVVTNLNFFSMSLIVFSEESYNFSDSNSSDYLPLISRLYQFSFTKFGSL